MSSIWNVLSKTKDYAPVITQEELDRMGSGKPLDDVLRVNAANDAVYQERAWRDELAELTRRLSGMPSVDEAQARVDGLMASVSERTKSYKDQIAECRKSLKTPFLSPLEQTHVAQKIETLEHQLAEFVRGSRVTLALAEGRLKDAQTYNPLRPRLEELRKRAAAIDQALKV